MGEGDMSRVCVKGLPAYLTEDRLKDHFSASGEITDAKIIRTSDGRSRQFAFVGYRSEEEALAAVNYFNRTFIDTSRLICEIARPVGDQIEFRPWSRHSKGSSAYEKSHEISKNEKFPVQSLQDHKGARSKGGENTSEDPELAEFLQAMQTRSKSKLWANDTMEDKEKSKKISSKTNEIKKLKRQKDTNLAEKAQEKAVNLKKASILHSTVDYKDIRPAKKSTPKDEGDEEAENIASASLFTESKVSQAEAHNLARDETISDMDYLKQRTKDNWSDEEGEHEDATSSSNSESASSESEIERLSLSDDAMDNRSLDESVKDLNVPSQEQDAQNSHIEEVVAEQQESVAETGRLFVRNLSYTTSEEDLQDLFGQYGELSEVHLVLDKETKRSKGFAYVLYMLPESAVKAMESLDMKTFQGRLLHILPAKRPPSVTEKDLKNKTKTPGMNQFKQDKEAQRRAAEASGSTQAWNALFMRSDTVAENVARRYGLSKSDLLNPEAEDLAVRMALGETQVIAETKKALNNEGVNIEVLEDLASGKLENVNRSKHVILVKNLTFSTLETELLTMFGKFGSIERIILPPTKTLAMVVYLEASEARAAMKGLAYKRFKHVPLYLEWAPENILLGTFKKEGNGVGRELPPAIGSKEVKRAVLEQQLTVSTNSKTDYDSNESRSVFIKNLNFSTSETLLKKHLQEKLKEGSVRSVTIKMKRGKKGDKEKGGKLLSMGYGFVEFDSPETANLACKQLQGTVLEGHALVLQLSHMKEVTAVNNKPADNNESSTKLIVRNVAFEATKKDLQQLFSPFGQIKSLRLPKKFDGNHRGFAFLEFLTKQEAMNAYNALTSTHLYGRHLVIEKAKESESLDELRARTASQYSESSDQLLGSGKSVKRRKKNLVDDGGTSFEKVAR
ncbi:hypothetical protein GOP47_0010660 [Adiantum capillus-veneris]|uniref:RRM domain-containing protein n=1 Tax=Adiantum capillus-veneris TaxID=13818 RepID=A0A9D4UVQ3_ADICA|nr:hypothetical protein GOP47_0010660 [Adiantum capillus-veneris]